MPVNKNEYDAQVTATTSGLHSVYDSGPIFSVNTGGVSTSGSISGQIWVDQNANQVQDTTDVLLTTDEVIVNLFDCNGNPVNSIVTQNGAYQFTGLYIDPDGASSWYAIQFELPDGFDFVSPNLGGSESLDSDVINGNRTAEIEIKNSQPAVTQVDAGIKSDNRLPLRIARAFRFEDTSYSVAESVQKGVLTLTIKRNNSSVARSVVVITADGEGPEKAMAGVNYTKVKSVVHFAIGETEKTVDIPIIDTNTIGFCSTRDFQVYVFDPTGRLYDHTIVYIFADGSGTLTDDDTLQGGKDWDVILGDSGVISATAVIESLRTTDTLVYSGGPGKDVIYGGDGPDYINGQLDDDWIAGNEGEDLVFGSLGNDTLIAELDNDVIEGQHGEDTVVSSQDAAFITLRSLTTTQAQLIHEKIDHSIISTFTLRSIEVARLSGGYQSNYFDITSWNGSAFIEGGIGADTLVVKSDSNIILKDASAFESFFYRLLYGFNKDASVSFATGGTYHLSSLEEIILTGGPSANIIDASGYSRRTILIGLGGDDTLIGGSGKDTFQFDADAPLGSDSVIGNGGSDTLDFSLTSDYKIEVDLSILSPTPHTINANLVLILQDLIENAIGSERNDTIIGNNLNNALTGGPGDDILAGGAGDEIYIFDTDQQWGQETVIENITDPGHDIIDFSGTTLLPVSLNLAILGSPQIVNNHLTLTIEGEGIEEVIGGKLDDTLRGNSNDNILRGGSGNDLLDGNSGNDELDGGTGNDILDGGEGQDLIRESENTNFVLTDARLTRASGESDQLSDIEIAELFGGTSANTFDVSGWTGTGILNGNDASGSRRVDTVIAAVNADMTVTDTSLNIAGRVLNLVSIERAVLTGGTDDNILDASAFSGSVTLTGGDGDDTLIGGGSSDMISGGMGSDKITGNGGNDKLNGGEGEDILRETRNTFVVIISDNSLYISEIGPPPHEELDSLVDFESAELTGGLSNNIFDVSGWKGAVTVHGSTGDDWLRTTTNGTVILHNTEITSDSTHATITMDQIEVVVLEGGDGDDVLDAHAYTGRAWLIGNGGNDRLISGSGFNILDGSAGNDIFEFNPNSVEETIWITGGMGVDTLDFSSFNNSVSVDLSNISTVQTVAPGELKMLLTAADIENIIGSSAADTLTGNVLNNTFTGGLGNDTINGGGGIDTIAELRDENLILTNANLTIGSEIDSLSSIEAAKLTCQSGNNTIDASGFTGSTALSGGEGDDLLIGGAGSDILIGDSGNDILRGNNGDDTYQFDVDLPQGEDTIDDVAGIDTLDFSLSQDQGITANLSSSVKQTVHSSNLKLTLTNAVSVENVIGTDRDDIITGNNLNNLFVGGVGVDTITGRGGVDTVKEIRNDNFILGNSMLKIGTEENPFATIEIFILTGGPGANIIDASKYTSGTVLLSRLEGNDALSGGAGNDVIIGGSGNDILYGNDGNDQIQGGLGNDQLFGGKGDDELIGGEGNDTYVFDRSIMQGVDTVKEYAGQGYADTLNGVGVSGVEVSLFVTTSQLFYDPNHNLVLTLNLIAAGQVEYSF